MAETISPELDQSIENILTDWIEEAGDANEQLSKEVFEASVEFTRFRNFITPTRAQKAALDFADDLLGALDTWVDDLSTLLGQSVAGELSKWIVRSPKVAQQSVLTLSDAYLATAQFIGSESLKNALGAGSLQAAVGLRIKSALGAMAFFKKPGQPTFVNLLRGSLLSLAVTAFNTTNGALQGFAGIQLLAALQSAAQDDENPYEQLKLQQSNPRVTRIDKTRRRISASNPI